MKDNICRWCKLPLLPAGEQVFPDRYAATWYVVKLGTCPRCGTTRAYGKQTPLTAETAQARGLPSLERLRGTPGS